MSAGMKTTAQRTRQKRDILETEAMQGGATWGSAEPAVTTRRQLGPGEFGRYAFESNHSSCILTGFDLRTRCQYRRHVLHVDSRHRVDPEHTTSSDYTVIFPPIGNVKEVKLIGC